MVVDFGGGGMTTGASQGIGLGVPLRRSEVNLQDRWGGIGYGAAFGARKGQYVVFPHSLRPQFYELAGRYNVTTKGKKENE